MLTRNFKMCPRCLAPTQKAIAINGAESEFFMECTKCNTFICTYVPLAHQVAVHVDVHKFVGNFGGYGSGKTTTSTFEVIKHLLITPNANILIGANVSSQFEMTIKRDIEAILPASWVSEKSAMKQYYQFINGARIMFRSFDDPNKLRSYNLTMFVMIEASEIVAEAFTQLKTRLRNLFATVQKKNSKGEPVYRHAKNGTPIPILEADWRKGIIESNPSAGWIRNEVLLKSSDIQKHGDIPDVYAILKKEADPAISTHITVSSVNEFLPPGFIEDVCKNKPVYWINRYIRGSFQYSDGLVYPSGLTHIVKGFDIPNNWKRIVAYDYGLSDNSVFLFGAVDPIKGILYIYKEVVTNNKSVAELAKLFKEASQDVPTGGFAFTPIIDPRSGIKRDYEKKSLIDHFSDYGVYFEPGQPSVDAGIFRVNTYFEAGVLKIFDSCVKTIEELRDYKFKADPQKTDGWVDKPQDKNNHCMDPMRWICMALPANPGNLIYGVYNKRGVDVSLDTAQAERQYAAHLYDEEEYNTSWNS